MSKIRGIFPAFLAAAVGVTNGIYIFRPTFQEQQEGKENNELKTQEVKRLLDAGDATTLQDAEAAASRNVATESALKSETPSSSWWPKLDIWAKPNAAEKNTTEPTIAEDYKKGEINK